MSSVLRQLWLLDLCMLAVCAGAVCCGSTDVAPFRSAVDGNRPIQLVATPKLLSWAEGGGDPAGARREMFEAALPKLSQLWNPRAAGDVQLVPVDLDEDVAGPCVKEGFAMWSIPGRPAIWVCPVWEFCRTARDEKTLWGPPGCLLHLAHELGHVLGARYHEPQNGRPLHGGGPVMCGWHSDCVDPLLDDYTAEDVAQICNDGGHGGRCGTTARASYPQGEAHDQI